MHRKYSIGGLMLALACMATGCNFETPITPRPALFSGGFPSITPGGPTSEPTLVLPTASDWAIRTPSVVPVPPPPTYAVVLVAEGGTLEFHSAAVSGSPAAGSLAWDAVDLHSTGYIESVGADLWVELNLPGGGTGWVARKNLTEYVTSGTFCADPGPLTLFPTVGMVVNDSDGSALAALVSPVHGLAVGYIHGGTPRVYTPADVASIFNSTEVIHWGLGPGSGLPVEGTFNALVRPDLINVFGDAPSPYCNTVQLGGASYPVQWPSQWKNINYYSVYKPGSAGQELDWMTWLVGVDYVDGLPYLFSLSRYNWEP